MPSFKINIKLFAESDTFAKEEFVPIFHHWIQNQSLPNHALIDVADYAHVPAGPGTLLVSSEANIHMDRGENKLGLLYVRKQPIHSAEGFRDQLRGVLTEALKAAIKLEAEPEIAGRLKFRTNEISIRLNDRLSMPNTPETFAAVKPEVQAIAEKLYGSATVERRENSPDALQEILIRGTRSIPLQNLLERV